MTEAGSVKALLQLDASNFDSSMVKSIEKVTKFAETMSKVGKDSSNFTNGIGKVVQRLEELRTTLKQLDNISSFENLNRLSNALTKIVDAAIRFNKEGSVTVATFQQLGNGVRAFMNAVGGVELKLQNIVTAEERVTAASKQLELALAMPGANFGNGYNNYIAQINQVNDALMRMNATFGNGYGNYLANIGQVQSSLNKTKTATDSVTTSTKNMGSAVSSSSGNVSKMNTATRGLTGTLNTLRMTVGMVASMFLFNFAHNMMISVSNTVKAKSEMLSFLNTMGLTQGQINSFNNALDQTAQRFQRINKYNIGETVANIGLEFGLSAKEMEKAMSVTSMVTSEYLRAGRNADEAALAVKDIMQGQFQRLSRETGVKGEQLKEAGWSGDVNDVMGLMDALEKVAKARHWDVFAEKASSLNDIVLITQNRLSEWATDVSEGVVPIITGAFNTLVSVVDNVTGFFQGLSSTLNLPDWSGTALLIGGVVTALTALVFTAITTRTHMGLLQIAQQGLRQSLIATVFGIKAEEMANVKATTVLKAKIMGVKTETMANQGLINILKAKVLGLDAEIVAEKGVAAAIEKKIELQELEKAKTAELAANNVSLISSYVSLKTGIDVADMAGLKWYQKLALLNKETDKAKVKNMGLGQSLKAFISSINAASAATKLLTGSIVALAGIAIAGFIISTMNSANAMKEFTDMVENGDEKIRKMKQTFGENSQEANNMTEAVEKARSAMGKFEERKYDAQGRMGRTVADYLKGMVNEDKLREISDASLRNSAYGVSQLAKLGDEVERTYRGAANTVGMLKDKVNELRGEEGLAQFAEDIERNADDIAAAQEKLRTSTSAMERAQAWGDLQLAQMGHWWNEFSVNFESHDWGAAWDNVWKGFMHGFGNIPIASDIWRMIGNSLNMGDHVVKGDLGATFGKMGQDFGNWIMDSIGDYFTLDSFFNDLLKQGQNGAGITDIIKNLFGKEINLDSFFNDLFKQGQDTGNIAHYFEQFLSNATQPLEDFFNDPLGSLGIKDFDLGKMFSDLFNSGTGDGNGGGMWRIDIMSLLGGLFGAIDSSGIGEWFNNTIILPIQEWFSTIDLSTLFTTSGIDVFGALMNMIFGEGTSESMNAYLQVHIIQPLMNLPSAIQGFLSTAVGNFVSFAGQLLQSGISAGSNFLNGVITHISQVPSRVWNYISQTTNQIISGAAQWVSNARSKAVETVNAVITQISQLPQKVWNEFMKIPQRIRDSINEAVRAATQFGGDVVNAVLNALHIHSPGIIQEKIATEFANIPSRIAENTESAKNESAVYGQNIVDGMTSQISNIQATAQMMGSAMQQTETLTDGTFVGDYQSDATQIYGINAAMTTDTVTSFGLMGDTVNTTISGVSTNLQTSYANMNTSQTTALTTMQNQNKTAYTNLQNQTTTSLNNMRSTTQNVTLQMVNAWDHMKDNIIHSADQLKSQSTAHFNTLSNNIGGFYRKLQNPSMWGGGDKVPAKHYSPSRGLRGARAVQRAFGVPTSGRRVAGGPSPDNLPKTMTLRKLKSMMGGNSSIFDGLNLDQEVNVVEFLSQFDGAFGWGDWHGNHFNKIKSTSGEWDMRGPQIMHRIDTGTAFKVKEFYNSRPNISFGSFQKMAEALFSNVGYEFYYNSDAHGNWVNALQAGSCNCYDGANALIALASTCGFSGSMAHGTWNGIPHVYAVINGVKMDTTGWQQRRNWNGVASGSPTNMKGFGENKTVNVNIDMTGATFNGEEDFENKMRDVAKRVIGEEVNTSITIGI